MTGRYLCHVIKNDTGEQKELPFDDEWDANQLLDENGVLFNLSEGNSACDCQWDRFFGLPHGECGDARYRIVKIVLPDGRDYVCQGEPEVG